MADSGDLNRGCKRIEELEARVRWLEGALAAALSTRFDDAPPITVAEPPPPPASAKVIDLMSFTNSFATLDARLHEQLEMESARKPAVELGLPAVLDEEMIDRAVAKPPPERIEVRCALEDEYPHLLDKIGTLWGAPESITFLRKLIVDERGGRQGFSFEVMSELLVLSAVAETPRDRSTWQQQA